MQRFLPLMIALAASLLALALLGYYFYERPTYLRVGVTHGSDAQKLIAALNQQFIRNRADIRFRIVPTNDARAAAKAMEERTVDIAVVRSDIAMPTNAQTALILEHQLLVIAAPAASRLTTLADLKGKRVAVMASEMSGEGNQNLLNVIETQYAFPPQAILQRPADAADLARLIDSGEIDAVLAFGRFDSPQLAEVVRLLSRDGAPSFLAIQDSSAIAKKIPGLETTTILRGAFGGSPSRPTDSVETIGATIRLVAADDLANSTVGDLVRLILANRAAAATTAPVANHIETPDTDKGEALPTHPGAAAFLDGEEETFFDKYSDLIYIGAMFGSVLISGVATLASRMAVRGYARFDHLMEQALTIVQAGRDADNQLELVELERGIDQILTKALAKGHMPKLDSHQLAALTLVVQQARYAISDRRTQILGRTEALS